MPSPIAMQRMVTTETATPGSSLVKFTARIILQMPPKSCQEDKEVNSSSTEEVLAKIREGLRTGCPFLLPATEDRKQGVKE